MSAPIRSQTEIDQILNRANHTIADLGLEIITAANSGIDQSDAEYRDDVSRLVLLRAYLKNILDPTTGETKPYYEAAENEREYNLLLDGVVALSKVLDGPGIPLIRGRRLPLYFFPSTSGASTGGNSNTGGPATPGGITFQNINISTPGEVVDRFEAATSEYAFYIVNVRGTGSGEGSRLDILGVNWRGASTPVITNYRGNDVGGSTAGVTYSAAIVAGYLELTCNVPTDGWVVTGSRISFEIISFQNALGPLPTGGTVGQYLRKSSSVDFDAAFASIQISEVALLVDALAEKIARDGSIAMTGNLPMGSNKLTGLAAGSANGDSVRYEQVLLLVGGVMSGAIAMGGFKITGLAAGAANGDAVRYEQVLLLTGGTMSGNIAMGGNKITGLAAATGNGEAVRYEQLNQISGGLLKTEPIPFTWNMYTSGGGTGIKQIPHGLPDYTKIRAVHTVIKNDDSSILYPFYNMNLFNAIDSVNITLNQVIAGSTMFNFTTFSSSVVTRGWITIEYEP